MIKVLYPPGCYGTFLTKCLYKLTSLNQTGDCDFVFDEYGSSHDYYYDRLTDTQNVIIHGHIENLSVDPTDSVVVIMPCKNHHLDYFDNTFYKAAKEKICEYIHQFFDSSEVQFKLLNFWNHSGQLTDNTPNWILREWCSFWIHDCLDQCYNAQKYQRFDRATYVSTQEIFQNLPTLMSKLAATLSLTVTVDQLEIEEIQKNFVKNQRLYLIQKKCQSWVFDIIEGKNSISPCQTIFDEAFVQHLLRKHGYEIKCNELNLYPTNAFEFKKLIYYV